MARQQDFITETRNEARALWDALNNLEAKQQEWNALAYGDNPFSGEGANDGYTSTECGAVVFDTVDAIRTALNTGHATNIAKLL